MRVTIVDKSDGELTVKLSSQTATEAMMVSVCALGETKLDVNLSVSHPSYPANAPPVESVRFGAFSIPVHQILQNKK